MNKFSRRWGFLPAAGLALALAGLTPALLGASPDRPDARPAAKSTKATGTARAVATGSRVAGASFGGARVTSIVGAAWNVDNTPIREAVESGQIRQFTGNDYTGPLAKGDLVACMAWSGDVVQLQADNPSLKWTVPDDGGGIWTDNMLIPLGGDVEKASTFMNFVYDPKIAAQIAAYVNYVTPVKGAKEELAKTDAETAANPLIFPDDATLAKVKQFDSKALGNEDYIEKWQALLGA